MSAKHPKLKRPSDLDLHRNPLIGGSKGTAMAQVNPDELEQFEGVNTFEGDVENDTNAQGGIDKAARRDRSRGAFRSEREAGRRRTTPQGKKTHEQQLRMLERQPDVPDARAVEQETVRTEHDGGSRTATHEETRQSEFTVSRGGMNQESQHNKHNHQSQAGHKPQKQ